MARQVRIELPAVLYYVMARANRLNLTFITRAVQNQESVGVKDIVVNRRRMDVRIDA